MHSNDPIDLEGLHESVVDSDEDLADSMDVSIFEVSSNFVYIQVMQSRTPFISTRIFYQFCSFCLIFNLLFFTFITLCTFLISLEKDNDLFINPIY